MLPYLKLMKDRSTCITPIMIDYLSVRPVLINARTHTRFLSTFSRRFNIIDMPSNTRFSIGTESSSGFGPRSSIMRTRSWGKDSLPLMTWSKHSLTSLTPALSTAFSILFQSKFPSWCSAFFPGIFFCKQ